MSKGLIESEFARFQLLSQEQWQAELCRRNDLTEIDKHELTELLEANEGMPKAFMCVERIHQRRKSITGGGEQGNDISHIDFKAGDVVGSYRLESPLGEGGFGIVWRAKQTTPVVREVAIKILKLGMDSEAILRRFQAEQQMLAMMAHPNIATLIEAGMTSNGRPFFVMELVKGLPITKYCDDRKLGIQERLEVFVDVCQAVNHAHQKGAIHRDLKPSNILVIDDATGPIAKVIDFGISQATKGFELGFTMSITTTGDAIGTPAYMAPEQFSPNNNIDTRTDVYALGAVLYELLVGTPPNNPNQPLNYRGSRISLGEADHDIAKPSKVLRGLEKEDFSELAQKRNTGKAQLLSQVSHDLEWITMKALERELKERYPTVTGLVDDIRKSQTDLPITARSPSWRYTLKKYVSRNRGAVLVGCSITLALLVTVVFSLHQAWSSQRVAELAKRTNDVEKEMRIRSEIAEKEAVAQRTTAGRQAYAANMLLAFQSHKMNDLRKTIRLLHENSPVGSAKDLRGWEWRYISGQTQSKSPLHTFEHPERVLSAIFSKSGEALVTFEDQGRIGLRHLRENSTDVVLSRANNDSRLASSGGFLTANATGTMIAGFHFDQKITGDFLIKIWGDPNTGLIRSLNVGSRRPTGLGLSPDGKLVAFFIPAEGSAVILDVISGAVVHREKLHEGHNRPLDQEGACSFSENGELLAIGGNQGKIVLVKISNWKRLPMRPRVTGKVTTLAFSPDGRQLVAGSLFNDPRVSVFDLTGEGKDFRLTGHSGFIAKVAFSPDGSLLASASGDQNIKLWRTSDWSEAANLSGHQDEVWSVDFDPNGQRLASSSKDRTVKIWHVDHWLDPEKPAFVVNQPFTHASLTPKGSGALTLRNGTATFHGRVGNASELPTSDIAQAFWISADRLMCGAKARPEITIRNLTGRVEQRLGLPEGVVNYRCEYLSESEILVVAMEFADSDRIRFNRYDVTSFRLLSSSNLEIPAAVWKKLGLGGNIRHEPCSFSFDGTKLAAKCDSIYIKIYDLLSGEVLTILDLHDQGGIQGMCLSPDGKTLAYAVRQRPVIQIYNVATGHSLAQLEGHNMVILTLHFSPNGKRLVSTAIGSEPILLWETTDWKQVAYFDPSPGHSSPRAWFLPSGNGIVIRETALESNWQRFRLLEAPAFDWLTTYDR